MLFSEQFFHLQKILLRIEDRFAPLYSLSHHLSTLYTPIFLCASYLVSSSIYTLSIQLEAPEIFKDRLLSSFPTQTRIADRVQTRASVRPDEARMRARPRGTLSRNTCLSSHARRISNRLTVRGVTSGIGDRERLTRRFSADRTALINQCSPQFIFFSVDFALNMPAYFFFSNNKTLT